VKNPIPMHGTITAEDWRRGLIAARKRRAALKARPIRLPEQAPAKELNAPEKKP
jgi:hypothetical protein